jgi:predicted transcriptional regulator of viral defense system
LKKSTKTMQTLTEKTFKLAPPGGLFDESVVRNLFPEQSAGARRLLVHRAVQHGEVHRLKRGLYCLAEDYRKSHPHPFVLAAALHSPSHISMESALSHHGLIPEAVFVVTSATSRRARSFETPLGHFSFVRVPAERPRANVKSVRVDEEGWAFVANPVRAIADLIYTRNEVTWKTDGLAFLTQSMRIEEEDLHSIHMDDIDEVLGSIRSRRVRKYLTGLKKEIAA